MIEKLAKHGNSGALVIDKPILKLLKISENTSLQIATDGKCLLVEPVPRGRAKKIEQWFKAEDKKVGEAYRRLSGPGPRGDQGKSMIADFFRKHSRKRR